MKETTVANKVFEAFHKDVDSDDFNLFEPGETNHFWLVHDETGKQFKVSVTEYVQQTTGDTTMDAKTSS